MPPSLTEPIAELRETAVRRLAAHTRQRPDFDAGSPRAVRQRALVTIVDVALTIGVDPRVVAAWERGDTDGADESMLGRWAAVLTMLMTAVNDFEQETRNAPDLVAGGAEKPVFAELIRRTA